jgi:ABC-type glycerol-3-phosphate transport system permease component
MSRRLHRRASHRQIAGLTVVAALGLGAAACSSSPAASSSASGGHVTISVDCVNTLYYAFGALMIPSTVLLVPQYVTVADLPILHLNLIGSPEAIWLPSVANAFNIFLLKRFFDSIPAELLAAAAIDGASPLLVEYGYNPSRETLNVGIFEAASTTPQNLVLAASAMAAVPTVIFFLVFQRNILAGLTAGSLKG